MGGATSRLIASLRSDGFRGALEPERPLAPFTTWRIGGPAELLAQPIDRDDLILAATWAGRNGVPWRMLGNGSNLLVRDEGVAGLVVRIRASRDEITIRERTLVATSGVSLPAIARRAAVEGLSGLEFAAGIPGTLGGALVMNAGWHEHEIGKVVRAVELLDPDGVIRVIDRAACAFGYRTSRFRGRPGLILRAELRLTPGDAGEIDARLERYAASRRASQPTELPSCGSVFLKPPGEFAGRLIEAAGLKGARVGGIEVSHKHANFFVNLGDGTCADALALVERVEREVLERFGVRLTREFELW